MPRTRTTNHNYKPLDGVSVSVPSIQSVLTEINRLYKNIDFECEPGEVLDIILDENHPRYVTPDDIGKVIVRLLYSQTDTAYLSEDWKDLLQLAKPADTTIKEYPLKHEMVLCWYYPTNAPGGNIPDSGINMIPQVLYYTKILNVSNFINQNGMVDISLSKNFKSNNDYLQPTQDKLYGETFIPNDNIKPLKHKEGDKIFEGRSGNSIRVGSELGTGLNPTIIIRNKQSELITNDNIIVEENINEDGSSIWLTSNMINPIELSSNKWDQFDEFPELSGNQITLNSDRILLNAKNNNLIFSANNSALFSANNEISLNSKYLTVNTEYTFIGKYDNCEPMVLGNKLISLLYELLGSLMTLTVTNAAGVSSIPINSGNFMKLINKLNKIVSKKAFVE